MNVESFLYSNFHCICIRQQYKLYFNHKHSANQINQILNRQIIDYFATAVRWTSLLNKSRMDDQNRNMTLSNYSECINQNEIFNLLTLVLQVVWWQHLDLFFSYYFQTYFTVSAKLFFFHISLHQIDARIFTLTLVNNASPSVSLSQCSPCSMRLLQLLFSLTLLYSQPVPGPVPPSQVTFLTGTVNVSLFWLLFGPSTHSRRLFQAPVKDSACSALEFYKQQ